LLHSSGHLLTRTDLESILHNVLHHLRALPAHALPVQPGFQHATAPNFREPGSLPRMGNTANESGSQQSHATQGRISNPFQITSTPLPTPIPPPTPETSRFDDNAARGLPPCPTPQPQHAHTSNNGDQTPRLVRQNAFHFPTYR
jgi:hypothetical protein